MLFDRDGADYVFAAFFAVTGGLTLAMIVAPDDRAARQLVGVVGMLIGGYLGLRFLDFLGWLFQREEDPEDFW